MNESPGLLVGFLQVLGFFRDSENSWLQATTWLFSLSSFFLQPRLLASGFHGQEIYEWAQEFIAPRAFTTKLSIGQKLKFQLNFRLNTSDI